MTEGFLRYLPFEVGLGDRIFLSVALSIGILFVWLAIIGSGGGTYVGGSVAYLPPVVVSLVISAAIIWKG